MGRSLVALSPVGLTHTRRCRGGCIGTDHGASDSCVGEHPDIRLSSSLGVDAVRTWTIGAAAVELLLLGHRLPLERAARVGGSSNLWEICVPNCLETLM